MRHATPSSRLGAEMLHDPTPDATLALVRDGYRFIGRRCEQLGTRAFKTRLMGRPVVCLRGKNAAALLYDDRKFKREGAAPARIQKTLTGEGAIQGMDDAEHAHRKHLFMSLMTPKRIKSIRDDVRTAWSVQTSDWAGGAEVVIFEQAQQAICRAACAWAGVPLAESEVARRADALSKMIDGFGAIGLRHHRGRKARRECERWIEGLAADARAGRLDIDPDCPFMTMLAHRGLDGQPLDARMVAIEMLNLVRPMVAVATYVTFAFHALHAQPQWTRGFIQNDETTEDLFIKELRRYYPFTPFVGARTRTALEIGGYRVRAGTRVLLDVYGMLHDGEVWKQPDKFDPERFLAPVDDAFLYIPQGGGGHETGHRCAGEWITVELIRGSLRTLFCNWKFKVPRQDLGIDLGRIPTRPASGFIAIPHRLVGRSVGMGPASSVDTNPKEETNEDQ